MKFYEKLNDYIAQLSCTAKDICQVSGISAASFSRYRNGERVPELGTKHFDGLCCALSKIAVEKNIPGITTDTIKEAFISCDDFVSADKELLRKNFNTLLSALNIKALTCDTYDQIIPKRFRPFDNIVVALMKQIKSAICDHSFHSLRLTPKKILLIVTALYLHNYI